MDTSVAVGDERREAPRAGPQAQAEADADRAADQAGPAGSAVRPPLDVRERLETVRIQALKDADGDYWLPNQNEDLTCLVREGYVSGNASTDTLATSEYGPFTTVTLEIREVDDPAKWCDDCLRDRHFCYICDDAVSHGHTHDDD